MIQELTTAKVFFIALVFTLVFALPFAYLYNLISSSSGFFGSFIGWIKDLTKTPSIIPYAQNNLTYEWSSPSNNTKAYTLFNQSIVLENSNVVGNYDYAQNKTTIERTQKSKTTKYEFTGMKVIKFTTNKGILGVEY